METLAVLPPASILRRAETRCGRAGNPSAGNVAGADAGACALLLANRSAIGARARERVLPIASAGCGHDDRAYAPSRKARSQSAHHAPRQRDCGVSQSCCFPYASQKAPADPTTHTKCRTDADFLRLYPLIAYQRDRRPSLENPAGALAAPTCERHAAPATNPQAAAMYGTCTPGGRW
jgi:hypothetical protein